MSDASESFAAHPHYSERMRGEFELLQTAPDEALHALLVDEAQVLLTSLLAIEDNAVAKSDDDKESGLDIARLERKLDLVLQLLAMQLMQAQTARERLVQISAAGARWQIEGGIPEAGSHVIASIQVHRLLPRALRLPAEVLHDEPGWLQLRFLDLGEACEELLVRHVFQQHRRQLAGVRRSIGTRRPL
ncbi:MAG: PilZ domain-containing protein [Panacagrimonas sp.]